MSRADVSRVAIAKPNVAPYGKAIVEALRALNIWQKIEPKVIYAQNVSQTKQYAATGNADVAFVPLSLVIKEPKERLIEVDEALHQPIDQALAVLQSSSKQAMARAFANFILSAEGQSVLESYGYRQPSSK